jgi:hypothetical protein
MHVKLYSRNARKNIQQKNWAHSKKFWAQLHPFAHTTEREKGKTEEDVKKEKVCRCRDNKHAIRIQVIDNSH